MDIRPQKGFQEMFLSTPADIAIGGGSAGAGKTYTLLMESCRHVTNKHFGGVIFRRTTPQIRSTGGLWDTSRTLYPHLKAEPRESNLYWKFPSGAQISFSHLEYDKNLLDWQGSQIPFLGFDELTHFSQEMFFYLLSRNRSDCGVRPYVRATCNPDPDSWVAKFISWWIDQDTGFPIDERAGVLRYMTRDGDNIVWGNTAQEVVDACPLIFNDEKLIESGVEVKDLVKSVTFIPGSIYDNNIFIKKDPAYLGNLLALPAAEKAQLLEGNWKIRLDGLGIFEYPAIKGLFETQYNEVRGVKKRRCITCDAARYGRDLCVIMVWDGWEVLHTSIFKKSDAHDIKNEIERLRRKFNVHKQDVVVDQDGVGDGVIKISGGYTGFRALHTAEKDPQTRKVENYKNLKTQCVYRMSNKINAGEVKINMGPDFCKIWDDGDEFGKFTTKIKIGGKIWDVRELIEEDLKSYKRDKVDMDMKLQMIGKDEQKTILNGRSPDFGDTIIMREWIDLKPAPKSMTKKN